MSFIKYALDIVRYWHTIYTTKIDGVVCPPNISETVAGRLMKLAHRPRIASTMIKIIAKPILLHILLITLKTIQPIGAGASNIAQINMQVDANDRALVLPSGRWPSLCRLDLERTGSVGELLTDCAQG